jgi:DNA mismatch repair protein mutL
MINILDKSTIDKIAAGEVVERPASIVKELLENAIDASSNQITVEIKDGGISYIRITDNGTGIGKDDIKTAFLRHATSKIKNAADLDNILSLGFRGEALSSISAVTRTEIISKTKSSFTANLYKIEGGEELCFEEVAAPDGTTIIIKDLFYNTPARRKFLKSPNTEAAYISDIVEKLALSNPDISFRYINNNVNKLHTLGNGNVKDIIYQIYGKEASSSLLELKYKDDIFKINGYIAKPEYSKSKRTNEIYFINSRYIKNSIIAKAIEDAYGNRIMQGKYPFVVLNININPSLLDVNVHPSKMEIRFEDVNTIYAVIKSAVENTLVSADLVKRAYVSEKDRIEEIKQNLKIKLEEENRVRYPENFERNRIKELEKENTIKPIGIEEKNLDILNVEKNNEKPIEIKEKKEEYIFEDKTKEYIKTELDSKVAQKIEDVEYEQLKFLDEKNIKKHRIVGQIFGTYWIVELDKEMFIIDQHAAHEKVLYERFLKAYENDISTKQYISPSIILSLSDIELEALEINRDFFYKMGFEIENFGGREIKVSALPNNLPSVDKKNLLMELIEEISESGIIRQAEPILSKLASISCKAAIKGNQNISFEEAQILIDEMLNLDNPYNCPHGRPTIIKMSKYEIEKKFKRIV